MLFQGFITNIPQEFHIQYLIPPIEVQIYILVVCFQLPGLSTKRSPISYLVHKILYIAPTIFIKDYRKSSTVRWSHVHQTTSFPSGSEVPFKSRYSTTACMLQHAGQVFQFIACVALAYRYLDMDFDQESYKLHQHQQQQYLQHKYFCKLCKLCIHSLHLSIYWVYTTYIHVTFIPVFCWLYCCLLFIINSNMQQARRHAVQNGCTNMLIYLITCFRSHLYIWNSCPVNHDKTPK